jgi:MATE family multidrug resistance protein
MLLSTSWLTEAHALGRISLNVTITMLAQIALGTIETYLVARLGTEVLAGVSLAAGIHLLVFLLSLGIVTAITPLASAAMGRGNRDEACRIGQAGFLLGLAVSLLGTGLLLLLAASLNHFLGKGPEVDSATLYLLGVAPGLPAWVLYVSLRSLAVATDTVRVTSAAMLAGIPVHAALVAWLTLGGGGLPPLGALGAGLAHAATGYLVLAVLAGLLRRRPGSVLAASLVTRPSWDRGRNRAVLQLGVPFACRILLREGVMPAMTLLLAPYGPAAVAAHAVAVRVADLLGVVAFGLSDAANARVGYALGMDQPDQAARSARIALQLSLLTGGTVSAIVVLAPSQIVSAILGPAGPEALVTVMALLPVVAAFLLLEIVMSAMGGALSGLRDAKGPLVIAVLGAWFIGLPLGSLLASVVTVPVLGLWLGFLVGAALTALMLFLRLRARIRIL